MDRKFLSEDLIFVPFFQSYLLYFKILKSSYFVTRVKKTNVNE